MKIRLGLFVLCVTVLSVGGCTGKDQGNPLPASSRTQDQSSSPSSPERVFADVKACEVLDRALQGQQFSPGRVSNSGSYNGCQAEKSGVAVRLDLDDRQGLDDLKSDPSATYEGYIDKRRAKRVEAGGGSGGVCDIAMEVAPKARAVVSAGVGSGSGRTMAQACEQAKTVATAVEPQLPKAQ